MFIGVLFHSSSVKPYSATGSTGCSVHLPDMERWPHSVTGLGKLLLIPMQKIKPDRYKVKSEPPSILLVDDHELIRECISFALSHHLGAVNLTGVSTFAEAVEQVTSQRWDMIVLDITIPGRNGLELLSHISHQKDPPPVLVCSMHHEEKYGIRALQLGAAGYMRKDAGMTEFMKAVSEILAGRKYVSSGLAASLANYFHPRHSPKAHDLLSERELQVLQKLGGGVPIKEIAAELCLSPRSISTYRARMMEKLKLRTISDLVKYCVDHGLLDG